jgi:hypothetical protein
VRPLHAMVLAGQHHTHWETGDGPWRSSLRQARATAPSNLELPKPVLRPRSGRVNGLLKPAAA